MNQVTVKVHCKNNDQWYDIDSSTDIEELIGEIIETFRTEEEDQELIDLEFDRYECSTKLLIGMENPEIPEDLPEAIEALEDADHDLEVYEAYEDNVGTSPSSASDIQDLIRDAEEAYQGEFKDDETFAENLADDLGYLNKQMSWPYSCIDWERAASELMMDYFESNGHYFRSI
jgi:hypothetical protein